jgi:16S rRNA processing protein RimM
MCLYFFIHLDTLKSNVFEELMDKIIIGQVVNVVGLKGELKVYHYSDYRERFEELTKVFLEDTPYEINSVRYVKGTVILKLQGIDDRSQAEKHKGKNIYIDKEGLRVLPEDTYYIFDLIVLYDHSHALSMYKAIVAPY